jgi:ketosteroid isomerase-like protein
MTTIEEMADFMRAGYAEGFLAGIRGPTTFFARRVEICFAPPRPGDGWFDGQRMRDYQPVEAAIIQSVMPDAAMRDVTVLVRAEDQLIAVMTLSGSLNDGTPFAMPLTMVYDVREGEIVRVVGLYDQQKMVPFSKAFEEAGKTKDLPTVPAPMRTEAPR